MIPAYPRCPGKAAVKWVNGCVCNSQLSVAGIKLGCWRMVDRLKAWSRSESQVQPSAVPGRGTARLQAGGRSLLLGCRLRRHLAARDRTAHPSHTGNRHARSHARRHTEHARAHCATTEPRFARTILRTVYRPSDRRAETYAGRVGPLLNNPGRVMTLDGQTNR